MLSVNDYLEEGIEHCNKVYKKKKEYKPHQAPQTISTGYHSHVHKYTQSQTKTNPRDEETHTACFCQSSSENSWLGGSSVRLLKKKNTPQLLGEESHTTFNWQLYYNLITLISLQHCMGHCMYFTVNNKTQHATRLVQNRLCFLPSRFLSFHSTEPLTLTMMQ